MQAQTDYGLLVHRNDQTTEEKLKLETAEVCAADNKQDRVRRDHCVCVHHSLFSILLIPGPHFRPTTLDESSRLRPTHDHFVITHPSAMLALEQSEQDYEDTVCYHNSQVFPIPPPGPLRELRPKPAQGAPNP